MSNEQIFQPHRPSCNCQNKNNCPMNNHCLTESVVYRADVSASGTVQETKFHIGLTCNQFKQRWYGHRSSFTHKKHRDQTALSTYIWELKEKGAQWSILRRVEAHKPGQKTCALCLTEKIEIQKGSRDPGCLNKRTELFSKCRHRNRNRLGTVRR